MTYTFHADPGHAWLEVPFAHIFDVGLTLKSFSNYSYRDAARGRVFLEEDCDAARFIVAWEGKNPGKAFPVKESHSNRDSFIRKMPRIHATAYN
jgi:hypothetical protein